DRRRERAQVGDLGLATVERQALVGNQAVQARIELRAVARDVEVDAAEARVVEGVEEGRPDPLHDPHQDSRLRSRSGEVERLVLDREAPLDLLAVWRPV